MPRTSTAPVAMGFKVRPLVWFRSDSGDVCPRTLLSGARLWIELKFAAATQRGQRAALEVLDEPLPALLAEVVVALR